MLREIFRSFCLAGTAERGEIFRQLFHTELYREVQNRLKEEVKQRWKQYDELRRSISQYLDGADAGRDAELSLEFKELKKEHFDGRAVRGMEILSQLLKRDEARLQEMDTSLGKLEETIVRETRQAEKLRQRKSWSRIWGFAWLPGNRLRQSWRWPGARLRLL